MAKTPAARVPAPAPPEASGGDTITIRMYRGLLGDCFLLKHELGGQSFHALIDCGVLQRIGSQEKKPATEVARLHIGDAVADLETTTGGKLDLVIATHEHYDHLSGFILHNDVFERFKIGAVWLAWTENDRDDLAVAIKEKRSKGLEALAALAAPDEPGKPNPFMMGKSDPAAQDQIDSIRDMLQFYGDIAPWQPGNALAAATPRPPLKPGAKPRSCADVFTWLKLKAGEAQVSYLEPGQQVSFGIGNRLKAHVLGPPRARNRLLQLDPTAGDAREVYLTSTDDIVSIHTTLRFNGASAARDHFHAGDYPFTDRFRRWQNGVSGDALAKLYYDDSDEAKGRRIDGEWLGSAETLALKIDGDVNNTSLALAIEAPDRRVLLFPADAQVGNWLSWHDQTYPAKPADKDVKGETAEEILGRVIFYKVGHHGSHNATARAQGLELMTSPDLVAMIPVVEKVAKEQKTASNPDGWAMPYGSLYSRLQEKTRKRILRGDGVPADEQAAFRAGSVFELAYADGADPLWVELKLSL